MAGFRTISFDGQGLEKIVVKETIDNRIHELDSSRSQWTETVKVKEGGVYKDISQVKDRSIVEEAGRGERTVRREFKDSKGRLKLRVVEGKDFEIHEYVDADAKDTVGSAGKGYKITEEGRRITKVVHDGKSVEEAYNLFKK